MAECCGVQFGSTHNLVQNVVRTNMTALNCLQTWALFFAVSCLSAQKKRCFVVHNSLCETN